MGKLLLLGFVVSAGLLPANPFQSNKECVAGKRVQVKGQGTGTIIGPDRLGPNFTCSVKMDAGGKTFAAIYWNVSLLGVAEKYPEHIKPGPYSCASFSGAVGHGGRLEVIPLLDFTVTGSSSYTGYDRSPGHFVYDAGTGRVKFTSGTLSGRTAQYDPNGTSLNMLNAAGQGANESCGLGHK